METPCAVWSVLAEVLSAILDGIHERARVKARVPMDLFQGRKQAFVDELKQMPIALHTDTANEQHYEVRCTDCVGCSSILCCDGSGNHRLIHSACKPSHKAS